jgi:Concanavalin A-like lectin/glucanases superfamily
MAYTNYLAVTIQASQCGSSNSTNFPMLFSSTIAQLATVANGGKVTNSSGYDIIFSSTPNLSGANILPFEIVSYSPTAGQFVAFVQVPTLSVSVNTVIYVLYGNSAISSSQANAAAVWSSYLGVWHFGTSGSLVLTDSTGNSTATNHGATPVSGVYNGGAAFAGGSSEWIDTGATQTGLTNFTLEGWIASTTSAAMFPISSRNSGSTGGIFMIVDNFSSPYVPAIGYSNGANFTLTYGATAISSSYMYVAGTHTAGGSNQVALYINGVAGGTQAGSGTATDPANSGNTLQFGRDGLGSSPNYFTGNLSEVRLSASVRSASWILATYNNLINPTSFYLAGPPNTMQAVTATGTNTPLAIGPITPRFPNMLALVVGNNGLQFAPAGWTQLAGTDFSYLQLASQSAVSISTTITGWVDSGFSTAWSAILALYTTSGAATILSAGESGTFSPPGVTTITAIAVTKGQTVIVWAGTGSAGNVGQDGADPVLTISDSAGNLYVPFKAVVNSGGFTYATYLFSAINVAANAALVISITATESAHGPAAYYVMLANNLVNIFALSYGFPTIIM